MPARSHRTRFLVAALFGALTTLASCGGSGGGGSSGVMSPPPSKELGSGVVAPGTTYTHRFFTAGTFGYHCSIHAVMKGVNVIVDASAPAADTSAAITIVGMTSPFFNPPTLTIRPGGKVVWTNGDGVGHTVTSD